MSNWVIVDSALKGVGGHNFTYTQIVREALRARGIEPQVLVNKAVPDEFASEFGFRPSFDKGAYDFPAPGALSSVSTWHSWAIAFERELGTVMPTAIDSVFSHTLGEFELEAWARFAPRLPRETSLVLLLRTTPGYLRMPWWRRRLHPYFRHRPACLRSLRASLGPRFRAVTDSEELSADLRSIYAGPVETFPIPIDRLVKTCSREVSAWRSSALTLGYLGDARAGKGFGLMPTVARAILPASNIRLLLQCVMPGDPGSAFEKARALLKDYESRGVELVETRLSREDYASLVAAMDIVLVPYTGPGYRESTSGIFAEAVATGKPVVVPSETWMAAELGRGQGAGIVYARADALGLARASQEAITQHSRLAEQATARAGRFANRHSPEALVEQLVAGGRA